jgi:hypothetical protein
MKSRVHLPHIGYDLAFGTHVHAFRDEFAPGHTGSCNTEVSYWFIDISLT